MYKISNINAKQDAPRVFIKYQYQQLQNMYV